jgi:hypothetical protein
MNYIAAVHSITDFHCIVTTPAILFFFFFLIFSCPVNWWLMDIPQSILFYSRTVVIKLCAAALRCAARNLKCAVKLFKNSILLRIPTFWIFGCAVKNLSVTSVCREPKSLMTTVLERPEFWNNFTPKFPVGFRPDSGWIPTGFRVDSDRIPSYFSEWVGFLLGMLD